MGRGIAIGAGDAERACGPPAAPAQASHPRPAPCPRL